MVQVFFIGGWSKIESCPNTNDQLSRLNCWFSTWLVKAYWQFNASLVVYKMHLSYHFPMAYPGTHIKYEADHSRWGGDPNACLVTNNFLLGRKTGQRSNILVHRAMWGEVALAEYYSMDRHPVPVGTLTGNRWADEACCWMLSVDTSNHIPHATS